VTDHSKIVGQPDHLAFCEWVPAGGESSQEPGLKGDQALVSGAGIEGRCFHDDKIELTLITPRDRVRIRWKEMEVHRVAARRTPVE
jgi:hypothetical protein